MQNLKSKRWESESLTLEEVKERFSREDGESITDLEEVARDAMKIAISSGELEIVKYLIKECEVNAVITDPENRGLLYSFAVQRSTEIGSAEVCVAAMRRQFEVLRYLLFEVGFNTTPAVSDILAIAFKFKHEALIHFLVEENLLTEDISELQEIRRRTHSELACADTLEEYVRKLPEINTLFTSLQRSRNVSKAFQKSARRSFFDGTLKRLMQLSLPETFSRETLEEVLQLSCDGTPLVTNKPCARI